MFYRYGKSSDREIVTELLLELIGWTHRHEGIDANTSIYKRWDKVSELLGETPVKHPIHSFKNALWAFEWLPDDNEHKNYVLIYYDIRGMKIQINKQFEKDQIVPMLEFLKDKLT